MKRSIAVIFVALLSSFLGLRAERVYNIISGIETSKEYCVAPKIVWEATEYGYHLEYEMEEVIMISDLQCPGCTTISIPEFGQSNECGRPSIPTKGLELKLPKGVKMRLEIVSCDTVTRNMQISPARLPISCNNECSVNYQIAPINYYEGYSNEPVESHDNYYSYRGEQIGYISLRPISYNMSSQNVRFYTHIECNIMFEEIAGENEESYGIIWEDSRNCLVRATSQNVDDSRELLIITSSDFISTLHEFIYWKKCEGYHSTILECKDSWSAATIKDKIIEFALSHSSLYGIVIVGDVSIIPSYMETVPYNIRKDQLKNYTTFLDEHCNDTYYGTLDNRFDFFPDVVVGRIPAKDVEELEIMMHKILHYEKVLTSYDQSDYPTRRGLHVSGFHAEGNPQMEFQPFIQTQEKIIGMMGGVSPLRVYQKVNNSEPLYFCDGTSMPYFLQYPNYSWDGSSSDVINHVNNGVSYVLYCGHGSVGFWNCPTFTNRDVVYFNNDNWYPPFFNDACDTGAFNKDCLSKRLLTHACGGSGVLGYSNTSFTPHSGFVSQGVFKGINCDSSVAELIGGNPCVYTIGDYITYGIRYMFSLNGHPDYGPYMVSINNWLGDPTMRIYSSYPKDVNNVGISISAQTVTVQTPFDCQITALSEAGEMKTYIGSNATFDVNDAEKLIFTGTNIRPTFISLSESGFSGDFQVANRLKYATIQGSTIVAHHELSSTYSDAYVEVFNDRGVSVGKASCNRYSGETTIELTRAARTSLYAVILVVDGKQVGKSTIIL